MYKVLVLIYGKWEAMRPQNGRPFLFDDYFDAYDAARLFYEEKMKNGLKKVRIELIDP